MGAAGSVISVYMQISNQVHGCLALGLLVLKNRGIQTALPETIRSLFCKIYSDHSHFIIVNCGRAVSRGSILIGPHIDRAVLPASGRCRSLMETQIILRQFLKCDRHICVDLRAGIQCVFHGGKLFIAGIRSMIV